MPVQFLLCSVRVVKSFTKYPATAATESYRVPCSCLPLLPTVLTDVKLWGYHGLQEAPSTRMHVQPCKPPQMKPTSVYTGSKLCHVHSIGCKNLELERVHKVIL